MEALDVGIISLIPIILTIGLAVKTRNVIESLFIGVFSGVLIITGGNPVVAMKTMLKGYILPTMMDSYNAGVIMLLIFIGGFVALVEQSGGAAAFANSAARFIDTRCKTQLAAWVAGILVFFSELGTPLIVGPIFSSIFRKMRISKEKLAWILDTTASPVCVLVPFIGWGVYSMGLIQTELDALNITNITDWSAFISAIPYQIYPILSLVMVPIVIMSKREFAGMAEREAAAFKGEFSQSPDGSDVSENSLLEHSDVSPLVVVLPLIVLFVTLFGILAPQGFPMKKVPGGDFRIALICGYLFAAVLMIFLMRFYKVDTVQGGISKYIKGCGKLFSCILMLILAWALSSVGKKLGTADYIVNMADGVIPAWCVPAVIFCVGTLMSFATGTSWGTFAIVMPIAIPMAVQLGAPLYATIAAVLSGGLFGDHCSPISDTTILASTGAGCGLMEHVWTQLPYVLLCSVITLIGYLAAGIYETPLVTPVCAVLLFFVYSALCRVKGISVENLSVQDLERMEEK